MRNEKSNLHPHCRRCVLYAGYRLIGMGVYLHSINLYILIAMEQLITEAINYVNQGYGDAYIISKMWAKRDYDTSINNIKIALQNARVSQIK